VNEIGAFRNQDFKPTLKVSASRNFDCTVFFFQDFLWAVQHVSCGFAVVSLSVSDWFDQLGLKAGGCCDHSTRDKCLP